MNTQAHHFAGQLAADHHSGLIAEAGRRRLRPTPMGRRLTVPRLSLRRRTVRPTTTAVLRPAT